MNLGGNNDVFPLDPAVASPSSDSNISWRRSGHRQIFLWGMSLIWASVDAHRRRASQEASAVLSLDPLGGGIV